MTDLSISILFLITFDQFHRIFDKIKNRAVAAPLAVRYKEAVSFVSLLFMIDINAYRL